MPSYAKQTTFRSKAWRRAVASLPCVLCQSVGFTQAAHRNEGKGMGIKTSDAWTAALCAECHADIDSGKGWTKEARREAMDKAILLTIDALAREGLVRAA